eukprot:gene13691-29109_t
MSIVSTVMAALFFSGLLAHGFHLQNIPKVLMSRCKDLNPDSAGISQCKMSTDNGSGHKYNILGFGRNLVISAMIYSTTSIGMSHPANAAVPTASELFGKAEVAIEATDKDYKSLLNDWSQCKKSVEESVKPVVKTEELIASVAKDLNKIESQISAITSDVTAAATALAAQVETLNTETVAKYDAAEASATSGASPSKTAKKFLEAENEAAILNQEKMLLKKFEDTLNGCNGVYAKTKDAIVNTDAIMQKILKISKSQSEGLNLLNNGIDISVKSCRDSLAECSSKQQDGVPKFKSGISTIRRAADSFSKVILDVSTDQ